MEIRRQTCQACHSIDVRNILVRRTGQPTTVYVRCARCLKLVARYKLRGYYHHGKDIDSYLRSRGSAAADSGRDLLEEFQRVQTEAAEGFEQVLKLLDDLGKEV